MKILFVLENYYPHIGGVETLFKQLAEALDSQGHQVTILTTLQDSKHPKFEKQKGINIYRKRYFNRYIFTFFAFFAAFRLAKHCDIIHTTSYNAALPAWLAAKLRSKKILITFHEVWGKLWFQLPYMSKLGARLHYTFEQLLLKLNFDKFIAVSDFTRQALISNKVPAQSIAMIHNGINYHDFSSYKHTPPAKQCFTFFGRLGVSKGIHLYLEAIAKLKKHHKQDWVYHLIIPKHPRSFLKIINQLIDKLDIRSDLKIQHHLPYAELLHRIAQSTAVVIPSYSEGFCFAAVETMAVGTPIISSAQGALSEVVSGRFITMDTFDAAGLASAMQKATEGKWQERPLLKFPLSKTVEKYLELYKFGIHSLPQAS